MASSWVDAYYEALDFFFWEPQHLGRKMHAEAKLKSPKDVQAHLRTIEVTLNHQLKQFFAIAPHRVRPRLFEEVLGTAFSKDFSMVGSDYDEAYQLKSSTQPDFLFVNSAQSVSLELKVHSKSTTKQVLKYALVALAVELSDGVKRTHSLIYLAPNRFPNLWPQKFATPVELRKVLSQEKTLFLSRAKKKFSDIQPPRAVAQLSAGARSRKARDLR